MNTLTSSDFSVEVHGLPQEYGDGEFLYFIDNHIKQKRQKVFKDKSQYDTEHQDDIDKLNQEYGIEFQKSNLQDNKRFTGVKTAITVKMLDNSIYNYIELTKIADEIKKRRTFL